MFDYKDQLSLRVASGAGGSGSLSFYRTRTKPRGGPDGGDGGKGGDLIFESSASFSDFNHLKKRKNYRAGQGMQGGPQLKRGRDGLDLVIYVPLGTVIRNQENQILMDFTKPKKNIFLHGGKGGRGNTFFKNSLNQAPRHFQKGEKAKEQKIILELKPLIDVAIIGKVNTGKSSFFNLVSKAHSKTGLYPYTTLSPQIGHLNFIEERHVIMDTPGLEAGASKTVFKGLSFLRSIQRARILLHFLDSSLASLSSDLVEIEKELMAFDKKYSSHFFKKLSLKKRFYILTKIDQVKSSKDLKELSQNIKLQKNQKIFLLSNKTKKGLKPLLQAIKEELAGVKV